MAETAVPANSRVVRYQRNFWREYIRENRFSAAMGTDERSPIQLVEDLTRNIGETVNIELINRLVGTGVLGTNTLEGNEEALGQRNFRITVDRTRHAVVHDRLHEQFSAIDLVEAKRAVLLDWFKENVRDRIVTALGSISANGSTHTPYELASATDRNTWLANNTDRVVFGANLGSVPANHAAGITLLDTTADIVTATNMALAKDVAKSASPKVKPIRVKMDEEWYLWYMPTTLFRQAQTALSTINQNAWERARGESNPLFTGGDLIYDGMIIKEIPEIKPLSGTPGAGGTTKVAPSYLVGAQAIGYGIAQRSRMISNERDYGAKKGAGIEMIDAIVKIYFGAGATDTDIPKQNGVVTAYYAFA